MVVLACLCGSASAATYYVATWGNNANPGTSTAPWATLQYAVDTIANGDTIYVKAGTYVGCRIEISGASGGVKTLSAEPGAAVVVNTPGPNNKHNSILEVESWTNGTTRYWTIDHLEACNSPDHYGIDMRDTQYITVQNCYTHNNGLTGIFDGFCDNQTYQNNETAYNGEHGIYHSNSGDYPIIRLNVSHHNVNSGCHINGDKFEGGDGLISYATVERNVLYENSAGVYVGSINCDGVMDSIIRNNLSYNNHGSGITLFCIMGAAGSSRNKVYNNTICLASDGYFALNIPKSGKGKSNPVDNLIYNNVLYNANPNSSRGSIRAYAAPMPGTASDYNVVTNKFEVNSKAKTFSQWQAYGYDLHSFIATPDQLFVSPATNNYHLKAGSLAANTGTNLVGSYVTDDLDGDVRPQGSAYDIGCYEDW